MRRKPEFASAIKPVFALVLAGFGLPGAAHADKRGGAPIIYASKSAPAASPERTKQAAPELSADKINRRIEFRYPDQPDVYVGAGGTRDASGAGPVAFSSATAAVTEQDARSFSRAPDVAGPKPLVARDPALSPGAFDARAAAAAAAGAETRRPPVVTEASLSPVTAASPAADPVGNAPVAGRVATIIYGDEFEGLATSNGETFSQSLLTGAHPTLPLPSQVRVTNPANGHAIIVRLNDRGPFEDDAAFQVSRQVAAELGFLAAGRAELIVEPADAEQSKAAAGPRDVRPAKSERASVPAGTDELLGGGASEPARRTKARIPVKWPEPPADWDVSPAPARTAPKAAAGGTHYVQLASFSMRSNAETVYRDLRDDLPVEIVPVEVNGTDFFRVRIGPLSSRALAEDLRDRLDAEGKGDGRVIAAE